MGAVMDPASRREVWANVEAQGAPWVLPTACDACGFVVLPADLLWNPKARVEWFMLRPDVWKLVTGDPHDSRGVLCVRCTEQALDRPLCAADFAVSGDADADIALRYLALPTRLLAKRREG